MSANDKQRFVSVSECYNKNCTLEIFIYFYVFRSFINTHSWPVCLLLLYYCVSLLYHRIDTKQSVHCDYWFLHFISKRGVPKVRNKIPPIERQNSIFFLFSLACAREASLKNYFKSWILLHVTCVYNYFPIFSHVCILAC